MITFNSLDDILPFLPLDQDLKEDIKTNRHTLPPQQQIDLERLLWGLYYHIADTHVDAQLKIAFQNNNGQDLSPEEKENIIRKTWEEFSNTTMEKHDDEEVNKLRSDIQSFMKTT